MGSSLLTSTAFGATKSATIPHNSLARTNAVETLGTTSSLGVLDTPLQFVLVTGIHKNLSLLLLHEVKEEPPVTEAITRYGMDKVQTIVVKAIRAAKSEHGAEWNEMLAGIYKRHFSDLELRSIMKEREASPFFGTLVEKQAIIAEEAKLGGKDIFSLAAADVLHRIASDLPL